MGKSKCYPNHIYTYRIKDNTSNFDSDKYEHVILRTFYFMTLTSKLAKFTAVTYVTMVHKIQHCFCQGGSKRIANDRFSFLV